MLHVLVHCSDRLFFASIPEGKTFELNRAKLVHEAQANTGYRARSALFRSPASTKGLQTIEKPVDFTFGIVVKQPDSQRAVRFEAGGLGKRQSIVIP